MAAVVPSAVAVRQHRQALFSQPPGSISGAIRVTEQGEMIRFKFGLEGVALQNLEVYTAATLEATLMPPPVPKAEWRELMNNMTELSACRFTVKPCVKIRTL